LGKRGAFINIKSLNSIFDLKPELYRGGTNAVTNNPYLGYSEAGNGTYPLSGGSFSSLYAYIGFWGSSVSGINLE
jgi:hypothetical protein